MSTLEYENSSPQGSENHLEDHFEKVNPQAAFVLSIIGLLISLVLCTSWCCIFGHRQKKEIPNPDVFYYQGLPFVALFLIAMSLFTSYAAHLKTRDTQDYKGLMRVTNVTYKMDVVSYGTNVKAYNSYARARYHLDWGYSWACPTANGYKTCAGSSIVNCSVLACDKKECKEDEEREALRQAEECAIQTFNPSQTYTPYDPLDGPSQDIDWPNIFAYGDCDTCEVEWVVASPTQLILERASGLVFLALAAGTLGCIFYKLRRSKKEEFEQGPSPEQKQADQLHASSENDMQECSP